MSRPPAETIMGKDCDDFYLDILESAGYWTIAYKGRPISIRKTIFLTDKQIMKYPRTGFNNRAHCELLAERLNKQFKTKEFTCLTLVEPT